MIHRLPLFLAALTCGVSASRSQIVQWTSGSGGNDHYYQLVVSGAITWDAASTAAQNAGGYLATLTSAAENTFVYNLAATDNSAWFIDTPNNGLGPWLGGIQTTFASEPSGGWTWVTGEPWSYTNWASGEPSNYNNAEDRLQLFGYQTLKAATWNDIPNAGNADGPAHAYIVEYNTNPIPEPSTYALIAGVTMLGITGWRRRFSKLARLPSG